MRIVQLRMAVDLLMHAKITPFIWGRQGIGKSQTVKDLCFLNDWGFVDERLAQAEAADLRGLAAKNEEMKKTVYYAPAQFPTGDLTMDEIVQQLANELYGSGAKAPTQKIGPFSPLKQLRLAAKSGKMPVIKGDKITFDGDTIPDKNLRLFEIVLKELQPRFPVGVLFYDEFNRAEDDVLNSSFEVVYDRCIGMHVLPPRWGVVCAGNYTEGFTTNPAMKDPALMDRFCHLELTTGVEQLDDWANYMAESYGEDAQKIIEFGLQNTEHVYGKSVSSDLQIMPSPRSWEMVAKVMKQARSGGYPEDTVRECIAGLVGATLAIKFMKYSCPIKPREIVERGLKGQKDALEQIVLKDKHARGIIGGLMHGVLSFAQDRMNDPKIINNLFDFAEFMAKTDTLRDLAVAFMRPIIGAKSDDGDSKQDNARAALLSNGRLAALVSAIKPGAGLTRAIDELNNRPDLKALMQNVAWGEE